MPQNSISLLFFVTIAFSNLSSFAFGGKQCRDFEKKTEIYFNLFYNAQDKDGIAKCKTNEDCILSARGPCNRQELASKLLLNKKNLRQLNIASKNYIELFEQCAIESCTKTRAAAKGTKCSEERCVFTYE